jgi:DNA repair protein RadC
MTPALWHIDAAIGWGRSIPLLTSPLRFTPTFSSARRLATEGLKLAEIPHEVFVGLLLDSQDRILQYVELFRGTLAQTSVYPREVVKTGSHTMPQR